MTAVERFRFDPAEFAGKRVLFTGGTKGAGEAIVRSNDVTATIA